MIVNFAIKNFGPIKEKVVLSFEATKSDDLEEYYVIRAGKNKEYRLLKLGLIYGANASGKTTLLKALDLLREMVINPPEKKTERIDFEPFLFDEDSPTRNSNFSLEFIQSDIKYIYELEFNKQIIVSENLYFHNPNKALVFKRKTIETSLLSSIEFGGKIKVNSKHKAILEANTLSNNTVLGGYLKTNFESVELQEVIEWFVFKLKQLVYPYSDMSDYVSYNIENKEIAKSNIVELLKKADFNISNIVVGKKNMTLPPEIIDAFKNDYPTQTEELLRMSESGALDEREIQFIHSFSNNKTYSLDYKEESEGTKRYYQFSGLLDLMIKNETIFPIDELESSLHPELIKHFLLTFLVNSKRSQIIATIHHRELLMERDILRDDVIWFTEKIWDGSIELFSLDDFDSSVIRNTSSAYNAYKTGKLGAVPNLNDYYINLDDE